MLNVKPCREAKGFLQTVGTLTVTPARRTQWHVLSASINNPMVRIVRAGPSSMLWVSADDNIGVTADGEVVVGRRRSHRADVPRPRPQCPGSPPCPWLGPPWSLVP